MSDTDNKTKNAADIKTADVAPYMKKVEQDKNHKAPAKTEMLIPAVLLLVSAIVIGATFYNKPDKNLLAQNDSPVIATAEIETSITPPAIDVSAAQQQPTANTEKTTEESIVQIKVNEQKAVAEINVATVISEPAVSSADAAAITEKTLPATNAVVAVTPTYTRYRYQPPYSRVQAQARAKQHMEMLQQRRQAYETEMQDRRTRYETAMKNRQEKQAKVSEAKKAVFQRIQKDRLATDQKVQAIHQQIAKLHEEIHQIMRESKRNAAPVKIHSM